MATNRRTVAETGKCADHSDIADTVQICLVEVERRGNDRLYELWGYCNHGKRVTCPALYRGGKSDSVERGIELRNESSQRKFVQSQVYVLPIWESAPLAKNNGNGQYQKL